MRALILILLLAGCSSTKPAVEVRTVEVPVIRVEKCVETAKVPRKPGALGKRPTVIRAAVDTLLAKVREWELYGDRADVVLRGCAG